VKRFTNYAGAHVRGIPEPAAWASHESLLVNEENGPVDMSKAYAEDAVQ